jgi:imidazoleglycerol-phosphate dehydratase
VSRAARIDRTTSETSIRLALELDGRGFTKINTGVGFFDHMLEQLGKHSGFDLEVEATGDLEVDSHHTVEDVGIALGEALKRALGDKAGIRRYGSAIVPMEEALVQSALDISGRPHLSFDVEVPSERIGNYDPDLTEEFMTAFTRSGGLTLHIRTLAGKNSHHIVEAVFKALARALDDATRIDPRRAGEVPSTKGVL